MVVVNIQQEKKNTTRSENAAVVSKYNPGDQFLDINRELVLVVLLKSR